MTATDRRRCRRSRIDADDHRAARPGRKLIRIPPAPLTLYLKSPRSLSEGWQGLTPAGLSRRPSGGVVRRGVATSDDTRST